jgi:hypothetical protein
MNLTKIKVSIFAVKVNTYTRKCLRNIQHTFSYTILSALKTNLVGRNSSVLTKSSSFSVTQLSMIPGNDEKT